MSSLQDQRAPVEWGHDMLRKHLETLWNWRWFLYLIPSMMVVIPLWYLFVPKNRCSKDNARHHPTTLCCETHWTLEEGYDHCDWTMASGLEFLDFPCETTSVLQVKRGVASCRIVVIRMRGKGSWRASWCLIGRALQIGWDPVAWLSEVSTSLDLGFVYSMDFNGYVLTMTWMILNDSLANVLSWRSWIRWVWNWLRNSLSHKSKSCWATRSLGDFHLLEQRNFFWYGTRF